MIDFDLFLNWAEKRFDSIKISGNEIKLNSIYDPDGNDHKNKLWCNPTGETKKGTRENGVFNCWISRKKGTLIGLVMDVDHCSYEEACEILGADQGMSRIEEQLEAFFGAKKIEATVPQPVVAKKVLTFPDGVVPINSLNSWHRSRKDAEFYLASRKIPFEGLYVGLKDDFRDRVVIPYYDKDGDLIYYNGRYIGPSKKPAKYRGPEKEIGVGKGDVIFMQKWVQPGKLLHVTEGEFDAMVLSLCGLDSCSVGGSHLTDFQSKILRQYQIKLCGDIDKPGAGAVFRTGMRMLEEGFKNIKFVRPPKGFKDWNDMYIKFDKQVANWIEQKTKSFDLITAEQLFAENM